MCGRYVIFSAPEAIRALFRYGEQPNIPPRYNIAPTQPIPIVRLVDGKQSFALMRWGLLPSWVEDPKTFPLLINARGESVLDKPAFRNAMRRRRCLIPTDGFYEWQTGAASGPKQPYFVRAKRSEGGAAAARFRRLVGNLDRPQRRRARHRRHRHDRRQSDLVGHSSPHAGVHRACGFRLLARLRRRAGRGSGRLDQAGGRRAARGLSDFACRQSRGERFRGAYRAVVGADRG